MYLFILPVIIFTLLRFNVFCFRLFYLCVVVFLILDYDLLLHYVKVTLFYKLSLLLFYVLPADQREPRTLGGGCRAPELAKPSLSPESDASVK